MPYPVVHELEKLKNPAKAIIFQGFFKTGKGQYGEGDVFWGISVPDQRNIAQEFLDISLDDIDVLLKHEVHEVRLTAIIILVEQYKRAVKLKDEKSMKIMYDFYLAHTKQINNWDFVDCSAPMIIGHYLFTHPEKNKTLYKLAKSPLIWERRISMVATYYFIKQKELQDTFCIAEILLKDTHDLMHKAVGWMLREAGKVSVSELKQFLNAHKTYMPRTALRYAIERFSESERKKYLGK